VPYWLSCGVSRYASTDLPFPWSYGNIWTQTVTVELLKHDNSFISLLFDSMGMSSMKNCKIELKWN
jgi:hypothetical protein